MITNYPFNLDGTSMNVVYFTLTMMVGFELLLTLHWSEAVDPKFTDVLSGNGETTSVYAANGSTKYRKP